MNDIIIEEFLTHYSREFDYYRELARLVAQQCEIGLERNGLRAIVTHRPKRPDRLRSKLLERNKENPYSNSQEIYNDIVDFAGVRIALYFPGDRQAVRQFIEENFSVQTIKDSFSSKPWPYERRFTGYDAVHYRVRMKHNNLPNDAKRYAEGLVEIQVASVLMHSWSEVEHDLIYKSLNGSVSETEYAIIDELNGLVLTGEIALKRLQAAIASRAGAPNKKFSNHYELSAFIWDSTKDSHTTDMQKPLIGRADLLFQFLRAANLDSPKSLDTYISGIDPNSESRALSEQVIDRILAEKPELNTEYQKIKASTEVRTPYSRSATTVPSTQSESLGLFLQRWISFEQTLRQLIKKKNPDAPFWFVPSFNNLSRLGIFDQQMLHKIDQLRRFRNQTIHGVEPADEATLQNVVEELAATTEKISGMLAEKP